MQSRNILEEQFGYMWCIRCLPVRNKVRHLMCEEVRTQNPCPNLLSYLLDPLPFMCEEVPTQIPCSNLLSYLLEWARCIQAHILCLTLSNLTNWAALHNCSHIIFQLGPVISFFKTCNHFVSPKLSCKVPPCISLRTLPQRSSWHT